MYRLLQAKADEETELHPRTSVSVCQPCELRRHLTRCAQFANSPNSNDMRYDCLTHWLRVKGGLLQLDDHLKHLIKELGAAINDALSDSKGINDAIQNVKDAGYDVFLVLEATIGF